MAEPKLLMGEIVEPNDGDVLNAGLKQLEQRIADKKRELKQYEQMIAVAASKLHALYIALSGFYGSEANSVGGNSAEPANDPTSYGARAGWDKWKAKLGGKSAEIIQTLLDHGPMTRTQLRIATGGAMSTIDSSIYKLRDLGLLVRDGDNWRLKS